MAMLLMVEDVEDVENPRRCWINPMQLRYARENPDGDLILYLSEDPEGDIVISERASAFAKRWRAAMEA